MGWQKTSDGSLFRCCTVFPLICHDVLVFVTIFSFVFDVGQSQQEAYHSSSTVHVYQISIHITRKDIRHLLSPYLNNNPSFEPICIHMHTSLIRGVDKDSAYTLCSRVVRFLYPQRRTFRSSKWGFTIWRHLTTGGSWNNSSPNNKKPIERILPLSRRTGTTRSWVAKERDPRLIHYLVVLSSSLIF